LPLGGAAPRPAQDALRSLRALIFHALAAAGGATGRGADRLFCRESSPLRPRAEKHAIAIGCSRGGRTAKIDALTDIYCRPIAFLLTGGHVADCIAADELLDRLVTAEILHGDKGYESDAVRRNIESKGAAPNIPPKTNRRWKNCFRRGSIVTALYAHSPAEAGQPTGGAVRPTSKMPRGCAGWLSPPSSGSR
jgi:transposase